MQSLGGPQLADGLVWRVQDGPLTISGTLLGIVGRQGSSGTVDWSTSMWPLHSGRLRVIRWPSNEVAGLVEAAWLLWPKLGSHLVSLSLHSIDWSSHSLLCSRGGNINPIAKLEGCKKSAAICKKPQCPTWINSKQTFYTSMFSISFASFSCLSLV